VKEQLAAGQRTKGQQVHPNWSKKKNLFWEKQKKVSGKGKMKEKVWWGVKRKWKVEDGSQNFAPYGKGHRAVLAGE